MGLPRLLETDRRAGVRRRPNEAPTPRSVRDAEWGDTDRSRILALA